MATKACTAAALFLTVLVGYSEIVTASDYDVGTKDYPGIEKKVGGTEQPKLERKVGPQTNRYPRLDCGKPEHQNLPQGERFVVLPMGNFIDKQTCLEWFVYTDLGHHENPEEGPTANYHLVYEVCESWLCAGIKDEYQCDGRWSVPKESELATLIVAGKQNPAFRDDLPAKVEPMNCDFAGTNFPDVVKNILKSHCDVWSDSTNSASIPTEVLVRTVNMVDGSIKVKNASHEEAQAWCVSRRLTP